MTTNVTLFDRLVAETQKLSPAPIATISKDQSTRWHDLATHWKAHPDVFQGLFYEAVFHIGRCRYSRAKVAVKPLLNLVEEAILNDMDALSAWKKDEVFINAFYAVSNTFDLVPYSKQRWKSNAIREYAWDKLYEEIFYRDCPLPTLTVKAALSRKAYLPLRDRLLNHSNCIRFEELIELLVPNCHKWSRSQWRNEKFIFTQIKRIHGIDFSTHLRDFDRLVSMFKHRAEHLPYYMDLFSIKMLPASIVDAIWPNGMEKEICKQFNFACNAKPYLLKDGNISTYSPTNPFNLQSSWAFKQITSWYQNKTFRISDATRSNLLLIHLGDHPWVVRAHQKGII